MFLKAPGIEEIGFAILSSSKVTSRYTKSSITNVPLSWQTLDISSNLFASFSPITLPVGFEGLVFKKATTRGTYPFLLL